MFVNYRSLIASWWSGIGLGTVGAGGYWAYDTKNPRISQWLLDSGYILNPPEITSNQKKIWDCSENIFKEDSEFEETKLYACGSAFISIWNSGDDRDGKINYLTFSSKFFIRKGNKRWEISTLFDNRAGDARYDHEISIYEKTDTNNKTKYFGDVSTNPQPGELSSKELNIKMPNGQWFRSTNYSNKISKFVNGSYTMPETYESFKQSKFWSGIWIEDSGDSSSWIFRDIEIFIEDKKYSQIFCKKDSQNNCYELPDEEEVWYDQDFRPSQMISQISSTNGKWLDAEKICKVGNKRKRKVNAEQLQKLKMFCSKSKNSLLETSN